MLKKEDGLIDWSQPVEVIDRQVRAFDPWPGTYTQWDGQPLKVLAGSLAPDHSHQAQPGIVVQLSDGSVAVATGSGVYCLDRVQLPGRPAVPIGAFVNGHAGFIGSRLG
jgi:methionyl-tRNA formyltransferase